MTSIYNQVRLAGNVGCIFERSSKDAPFKFLLIVNDYWKNEKGERESYANPIICTAWGKLGRTLEEHISVGTELHVEGALRVSKHEGVYYTEVVVSEFIFGRRPKDKNEDADDEEAPAPKAKTTKTTKAKK